uniref:DH domain-containing protein n=1 Tax=Anolis carolinensis TaxID=28377 RepID=A0A803TWV6_ANOCA
MAGRSFGKLSPAYSLQSRNRYAVVGTLSVLHAQRSNRQHPGSGSLGSRGRGGGCPSGGGDASRERRPSWARCRPVGAGEREGGRYFVALLKAKGTLEPDAREAIFAAPPGRDSVCKQGPDEPLSGGLGWGYIRHGQTWARQRQVRKNKAFSRFKRLQETRPEFGGSRLEDLLLLPLQRLRQPALLFLAAHCPSLKCHPGLFAAALKSVAEAVHQIQEIARFHENMDRLSRIQKLLKGQKTQVMQPGRWFLQEGWLMVAPPKGEGLRPRMFFLFSDVLLMARPCHPLHPWNAHKVAVKEVLWLQPQCSVAKVFGHSRGHGGLLSVSLGRML